MINIVFSIIQAIIKFLKLNGWLSRIAGLQWKGWWMVKCETHWDAMTLDWKSEPKTQALFKNLRLRKPSPSTIRTVISSGKFLTDKLKLYLVSMYSRDVYSLKLFGTQWKMQCPIYCASSPQKQAGHHLQDSVRVQCSCWRWFIYCLQRLNLSS